MNALNLTVFLVLLSLLVVVRVLASRRNRKILNDANAELASSTERLVEAQLILERETAVARQGAKECGFTRDLVISAIDEYCAEVPSGSRGGYSMPVHVEPACLLLAPTPSRHGVYVNPRIAASLARDEWIAESNAPASRRGPAKARKMASMRRIGSVREALECRVTYKAGRTGNSAAYAKGSGS